MEAGRRGGADRERIQRAAGRAERAELRALEEAARGKGEGGDR